MISFWKKNFLFLLICSLPIFIYWPSLFVFFTNDDFYFLKIANQVSFPRFVNYFNIFTKNPDGFGVYRPLTTQLFYLVRDPLIMHIIVFLTFFGILYLIYKLGFILFKNKNIAFVSAFLYSVSATHFGHFYYLATYQELGATLFVLLMIINHLNKNDALSNLFFVFALMSKETAVVAPFLLFLVDWYVDNKMGFKKYLPYIVLLSIYLLSHFYLYGLASGDTYIWDFNIKSILNTTTWYLLWSLNLPETFIDFVGPGLSINPNLFIYWSRIVYPIISLFIIQVLFIGFLIIKYCSHSAIKDLASRRSLLFSMTWFLISLVPVIFLPQHKFTFYLTLPIIGFVFLVSYLFSGRRSVFTLLFLVVWTSLSVLTIKHTVNTNWITQGENVSRRVQIYFNQHAKEFNNGFVFTDTKNDSSLPWSPTQVVKTALSDKNFFFVFYPNLVGKISYYDGNGTKVSSRQFLGY